MYNELTPEQEKEIIDKVARFLVKHNMTAPAILFLDSFKSLAWLGGSYASILIEPFLPFYEKEVHDFIQALGKIENTDLLINKIEELNKEKQESEIKEKSKTKEINLLIKINKLFDIIKKKILKIGIIK